jgi:hypothetical protein
MERRPRAFVGRHASDVAACVLVELPVGKRAMVAVYDEEELRSWLSHENERLL